MSADRLLQQLAGVRKSGPGRWLACCPAHQDRSPSLSVRELEDGRVLVHCFAQCSVEAVLRAVGLTFSDLFPPSIMGDAVKGERRPFNAHDVLAALVTEARIVAVASANLRDNMALSGADHDRLLLAVERIEQAEGLANGGR